MSPKKKYRWALLVTISIGLFVISLDNTILYTALPKLIDQLGASRSEQLWIINAYPVMIVGLLLGAGTLGDRVGHRRMFVIGLIVFGLASAVSAFAPNSELLIAGRGAIAVGAACMLPATLALIRLNFDQERERNIAIAVWGTISVIGFAVGPVVGGMLLQQFWWGSVFLVGLPFVVVALLATLLLGLPNDPNPDKHWDVLSSLQVMVGLVCSVFFIEELSKVPRNWTMVAIAGMAAVIGLAVFARRQRRLADPLLDFGIFGNAAFLAGVLSAAFSMFGLGGLQLVTTQRFQFVESFSPLQAGLLVTVIAAGCLPTSVLSGIYLDRVGLLPLIGGGLGLGAVGAIIMTFGIEDHLFWVTIVGLFVAGLGLGSVFSVASTAIVGNVTPRRSGMASSVEEVSYEFGSLLAVSLLGSLMSFVYSATVRLPAGTPQQAQASLPEAMQIADGNQLIIGAARTAFNNGFLAALIALSALLAIGAIVTGWLLRHYGPGSQSQLFADNSDLVG